MVLNWALISLKDIDIRNQNTIPYNLAIPGTTAQYFQSASGRLCDFIDPCPGDILYKKGRTTGITKGQVNAVMTMFSDALKCWGGAESMESPRAYGIFPVETDPPFGIAGDSGSAVFDIFGNYKGMFIGGETQFVGVGLAQRPTSIGYIMPQSAMLSDILAKTGATRGSLELE
jgi:hypothetical protein